MYEPDNLQSTSLSFVYTNGNLYEESYLKRCALAKLKSKTIFKPIANVENRGRSIEMHNYAETIHEVYKSGDTMVTADLEGYDNLSLAFDTKFVMMEEQQDDSLYTKSLAIGLLQFLAKRTQFSEAMEMILDYYENNDLTAEFVELEDNYSFRILIHKDEEETLRYLLQIIKTDNPNQTENWGVATRQKKRGTRTP